MKALTGQHLVVAAVLASVIAPAVALDPTVRGASLERPAQRDDTMLPYRPVTLTVTYRRGDEADISEAHIIRGVKIRSTRGGPAVLVPVTVAPGTTETLTVPLPVLSVRETYRVSLLAEESGDSPVLDYSNVSLTWPAEEVTADAFLDPQAYQDGDYSPPRWSAGTARGVFVTGVVAALAMAAALFVRSPRRRAGVLLAVLVGASAVMAYVATREPVVVRRFGDDGRLLVISTRRTTDIRIDGPGWAPLYYDEDHMSAEALVVRPGKDISGPLRPDDVRLFRKVR